MRKKSSNFVLLLFTIVWTFLVFAFDAIIGVSIWRQYRSTDFPSVPGKITHSEVTRHNGSKGGTTYGVDIRYNYEFGGTNYQGERFRYNQGSSSDSAWARRAVAKHSVGSEVNVFYDPANPAEAILEKGVNGGDLFLTLFLMPFNMAALGLMAFQIGRLKRRLLRPVAGGVRIIRRGMRTTVRLPRIMPAYVGIATLLGCSFASIFVVAIKDGFHPELNFVLSVWAVVLALGLIAFVGSWYRTNSGIADLTIDEAAQLVTLPRTFGRRERITASFDDIAKVKLKTIEHTGSKGGTSYTYAPTLVLRNGDPEGERIAEWHDLERAESFIEWLKERMGNNIVATTSREN